MSSRDIKEHISKWFDLNFANVILFLTLNNCLVVTLEKPLWNRHFGGFTNWDFLCQLHQVYTFLTIYYAQRAHTCDTMVNVNYNGCYGVTQCMASMAVN